MFGAAWETFLGQPFDVGGGLTFPASALSMGNPHLVVFVDEDPDRYHLEHIGPALEHHELFPERTNVELARVADGERACPRMGARRRRDARLRDREPARWRSPRTRPG